MASPHIDAMRFYLFWKRKNFLSTNFSRALQFKSQKLDALQLAKAELTFQMDFAIQKAKFLICTPIVWRKLNGDEKKIILNSWCPPKLVACFSTMKSKQTELDILKFRKNRKIAIDTWMRSGTFFYWQKRSGKARLCSLFNVINSVEKSVYRRYTHEIGRERVKKCKYWEMLPAAIYQRRATINALNHCFDKLW